MCGDGQGPRRLLITESQGLAFCTKTIYKYLSHEGRKEGREIVLSRLGSLYQALGSQ